MKKDAPSTSFRLSPEARAYLKRLAEYHGVGKTAVLERLLREEGRKIPADFKPQTKPKRKSRILIK